MMRLLGIDAGGTHTDAVLLTREGGVWRLTASAKVPTCHEDLPATITSVLAELKEETRASGCPDALQEVERVSLGTTLAVNALVQGKADRVGLVLSAGPGLEPRRFALGEDVCVLPGGLDHRGVEVTPLDHGPLEEAIRKWQKNGVSAIACVGKFSPRNPEHEQAMGRFAEELTSLPVCLGHRLSGQLNFPRRIATAYFNAAVSRIQGEFLDAAATALKAAGIDAAPRLLKADGGAAPFALAKQEPVQSILSGPAASVMGVMALCPQTAEGCSLLLDMGGTTSDIALFADGSPVMERDGMLLQGRRTQVRSLACISIGVGGDSSLMVEGQGLSAIVTTGPERYGPAMAFGGRRPTLLDALNFLDAKDDGQERGDIVASRAGIRALAEGSGLAPRELARQAVEDALAQIALAVKELVDRVNACPIYTLAALRAVHEVRPTQVWLVGGPSHCIRERLAAALSLPVSSPPYSAVANAVGAALSMPSYRLETYTDTGRAILRAPALDRTEPVSKGYTLEMAKSRSQELLADHLQQVGAGSTTIDVVEADTFATLDARGHGSKDIRIVCQVRPGIAGPLAF